MCVRACVVSAKMLSVSFPGKREIERKCKFHQNLTHAKKASQQANKKEQQTHHPTKARAVRSKKQASNSISKKYSVSFSLYNIHV